MLKKVFTASFLLVGLMTQAQLRLPDVFGDGMVVQRHDTINIWGTANAGDKIEITFGSQKVFATADQDGTWYGKLAPMEAGGPYILTIASKKEKYRIRDVMVGEVWICSGQSNMRWMVSQSMHKEQTLEKSENEMIRLFDMTTTIYPSKRAFDQDELGRLQADSYYEKGEWLSANKKSVESFSAVAYHFGRILQDSLGVPIGLIHNAIGGSTTEAWVDLDELLGDDHLRYLVSDKWPNVEGIHPWVKERSYENLELLADSTKAGLPLKHPFAPGYLYETGIRPLVKYSFNGVIWYQGESNATHPELHERLFRKLINTWRDDWEREFPFLYVQLPNFSGRSRWPEMRQTQESALDIPNTAMAVVLEWGNPKDIHPRNKKVVGERLAWRALDEVYDYNIESQGPVLINYKWQDSTVTLTFDHGVGLRSQEDRNTGVYLQGYVDDDTKEVIMEAEEVLVENNKMVISIPSGLMLTAIKYAWVPNASAIYFNEAGFPMPPFRLELPGNF